MRYVLLFLILSLSIAGYSQSFKDPLGDIDSAFGGIAKSILLYGAIGLTLIGVVIYVLNKQLNQKVLIIAFGALILLIIRFLI